MEFDGKTITKVFEEDLIDGKLYVYNGITKIGNAAFSCLEGLIEVRLPESLEEIGSYAFMNCHNLKITNIPSSLTKIGNFAFYDCFNLDLGDQKVPDKCEVGFYAFKFCGVLPKQEYKIKPKDGGINKF